MFDKIPNGHIDNGHDEICIFDNYPNREFDIDGEEGRLIDIVKERFLVSNVVGWFLLPTSQIFPTLMVKREDYLEHLEDPLRMVYTRESLGHGMRRWLVILTNLEPSLVTYVEEMLSLKRHGK